MYRAAITGWGMYVPEHVLTNDDLSRIMDTSDEWIRSRTGIRERRTASATETTVSMATSAGMAACKRAGIEPADLELVIVATFTPDQYMPSTASSVQHAIGATHAAAFDMNTACSGFVYALATGSQFVRQVHTPESWSSEQTLSPDFSITPTAELPFCSGMERVLSCWSAVPWMKACYRSSWDRMALQATFDTRQSGIVRRAQWRSNY
jgi:hypothetical protein